jgi:dienelactone hydrolase
METLEYAPGRMVDLVGDRSRRTVLLWHGQQANARTAVRPLAEMVAAHGMAVVVPDWDSHGDDGGHADLLDSVRFARERAEDPDNLVLVGWSLGGAAAAGLTAQASRYGVRFACTICLAGPFMVPEPITGKEPAAGLPGSSIARHLCCCMGWPTISFRLHRVGSSLRSSGIAGGRRS